LKFFPPEFVRDQAGISAARKVLEDNRCILHPGVVSAQDLLVSEKYAAFVTPWIDGPSFRQMMNARPSGCLDVDFMRPRLRGLLNAVEAAHLKGVVHGSLAPDLVLQGDLEIVVAGFGVNAWLRHAAMRHGKGAFREEAPGYLAPSVRRGGIPKPQDDIFALGALVYELLTGVPPKSVPWWRRHASPAAMTRQRRRNGRNVGATIPAVWERAIAKCLEPRERDRIRTLGELRLQLGFDENEQPVDSNDAREKPDVPVEPVRIDIPEPPPARETSPSGHGWPQPTPNPVSIEEKSPRKTLKRDHVLAVDEKGPLWLRALLVVAILATIATGAGLGWKVFERLEKYRTLLADVRELPASAPSDERDATEARVSAARPDLTSRQWSNVRTLWREKRNLWLPVADTEPPKAEPSEFADSAALEATGAGLTDEMFVDFEQTPPVEPGENPGIVWMEIPEMMVPGISEAAPVETPEPELVEYQTVELFRASDVQTPAESGSELVEPPDMPAPAVYAETPAVSSEMKLPVSPETNPAPERIDEPADELLATSETIQPPAIEHEIEGTPEIVVETPSEHAATDESQIAQESGGELALSSLPMIAEAAPPVDLDLPSLPTAAGQNAEVSISQTEPPVLDSAPEEVEQEIVIPEPEVARVQSPESEVSVPVLEPPVIDNRIFELDDVDVAPRLTSRVEPELSRRRGSDTRIDLIVVVDRNGRIASTLVKSTTRKSLVEPVLRAVRQWRFMPATKSGQDVPVRMTLPLVIPAS
jgi:TonB family protein